MGLTTDDAKRLYIYSYAIVISNVLSKGKKERFINLSHGRRFVSAKEDFPIVRPNNDTLYSSMWTHLKESPYILEIPEVTGRYLLVNFLNTKTDIPFAVGSKNQGGSTKGKYILLFRDEAVPAGYEEYEVIRSEDSRNFVIVRLEAFGEEDYPEANSIQDQIVIKPVYPEKIKDFGEQITGLSTYYVEKLSVKDFYQNLAEAYEDTVLEESYIELLNAFGIDLASYDYDKIPEENKKLLEAGAKEGYQYITHYTNPDEFRANGWKTTVKDLGYYGTNYDLRSVVAYVGYGANLAEDSVYPSTDVDENGEELLSSQDYLVHFEKDGLPNAQFFWSLTLYGLPSQYLSDNEIDRYLINSHMLKNLTFNEDGSVDIIISRNRPKEEKYFANWLPAPTDEEKFSLTMRIYGPDADALNGKWAGPSVRKK